MKKATTFKCAWMLIFVLLAFSCGREPAVPVTRIGELEDLIKKGEMGTRVMLKDYASTPNLYAIGTVTNLKGFVQIIDGKSYTSYIENNQVKIDSSFDDVEAALFLGTEVEEWKEFELPADVKTWKQLEQFIGNQATKYKVPKRAISPFLLKGIAADLKWRVINWDLADKVVTYKKTTQSGIQGEIENEYITAVGFYSRESYEVLAHKETNMHIHFVNHDHSIAGHLDELVLDGRLKLYLPKKYDEE